MLKSSANLHTKRMEIQVFDLMITELQNSILQLYNIVKQHVTIKTHPIIHQGFELKRERLISQIKLNLPLKFYKKY